MAGIAKAACFIFGYLLLKLFSSGKYSLEDKTTDDGKFITAVGAISFFLMILLASFIIKYLKMN